MVDVFLRGVIVGRIPVAVGCTEQIAHLELRLVPHNIAGADGAAHSAVAIRALGAEDFGLKHAPVQYAGLGIQAQPVGVHTLFDAFRRLD